MSSSRVADRRSPIVREAGFVLATLFTLLCGVPRGAHSAPIALVQHAGKDAGTTISSTLAFTSANTAGNWIAVLIRAGQSGQAFTVTDTRGNTYREAVRFSESVDASTLGLYYAENIGGGANTVTVSGSIAGGTLRFAVMEYAGVATSGSLDVTATAQGTGSAPGTGSVTTSADGALVLGLLATANAATITAGSGYALREQVLAAPTTKLVVEDRILTAAGPVAVGGTLGASDAWGAVLAAFRPAADPAADAQPPTAPGSPALVAPSTTQTDVRWTAATDNIGVTTYRVERCQGAGCSNFTEIATVTTASTPLPAPLTVSANPNYFKDASGRPLILNGSHTWNSLQDWGTNGTLQPLDFTAFVNFLVAHGHNFTYLWRTELPRFCGLPTTASSPPDFTVGPHPWQRTGPGTATDGGPKFDLTKFDQAYFDRLRTRVQALNAAGIYAGVYLFTGEWLAIFRCANDGFPFTGANNVNGINDGGGVGSMTMTSPNAITAFQDAYVDKVIDTLNDLPNVLWIVSEEAPATSAWWNDHLIAHVRAYEAAKPFRHPIGFGVMSNWTDAPIYNSNADWVNPYTALSPTTTCGSGTPACKVNINDSDHSYFGMWNESAQANRNYAWRNFTNGNQVVFMDPYVVYYPRESRNLGPSPANGICSGPDARWNNFRDNLGAILRYSRKLNLAGVMPRASLASTSHCLAQTPSVGAEYLVYAPSGGAFTVNLSAMSSARTLNVEWFNPATGVSIPSGTVPAGSTARSFTPPFSGDAVLYLVDAGGHAAPPAALPTSYAAAGQAGASYGFRIRATDAAGNLGPYSGISRIGPTGTTGVEPVGGELAFALEGVRPNPTHGSPLAVWFTLPVSAPARLELFDIAGRRLSWQDVGTLGAGRHSVQLAADRRLPPGLFLVRLTQGGASRATRVAVVQ